VFAPFGDIEFINLHLDPETNRSKGFAFVQYKRPEDAKKALHSVNGLEIAGRQIKVGLVNETKQEAPGLLGELDDDEGGGLSLNAQSRAMLMAKLQRGGALAGAQNSLIGLPIANPATVAGGILPNVALNVTSPCILLKNMFDPSAETEPNWDQDIKEDVAEECGKFGSILHVHVDKNSQGFVHMKFGSITGAQNAINALNKRWFAGRMITAEFIPEPRYHQLFPEAQK